MTTNSYSQLFSDPLTVTELLTIKELAEWQLVRNGSRLLLPPIQRSVVWSNEQVINYWDSLLRGYPAGLMLVHRVNIGERRASRQGRDADGATCDAINDDFQLFDGQQRMAAVLLGLGKGQLKDGQQLWVDCGMATNKSSGLKFQLRMTSKGQPFGYMRDAPNRRIELGKRRSKWQEWQKRHPDKTTPQQVFENATGGDVIDATCAVSFANVYELLSSKGLNQTIATLSKLEGASAEIVEKFARALEVALETKVILQQVSPEIVVYEDEYIRFFGRLGQGGTRLSDDELTYSIIKHQYPKIHDRMRDIMDGQAGRLAGEVDLVLAALRVAKVLVQWDNANEWELISRPNPAFVSQLKDRPTVQSKFLEMIPPDNETGRLATALGDVRRALSYDADAHPKGLPAMLLARLPRELVDVLILFAVKSRAAGRSVPDDRAFLRAFVLHWLLFVGDDGKAANFAFQHAVDKDWVFTQESICKLIQEYENNRIARMIPRQVELDPLRNEVCHGNDTLRLWAERFTAVDHDSERKPGQALRVLSTYRELVMRGLMWLQRDYIAKKFPNYDPTSDRDEDLPIDLDHIVPQEIFNFNWRSRDRRLQKDAMTDNFRLLRSVVGNSLGNFRWIDASENRGRGKGAYIPIENDGDLVPNPDAWNEIIQQDANNQPWSRQDIADFQRLIDLRTIYLLKNY